MPKEVSIDAIVAHVHAIIEQGRQAEFIVACSEQALGKVTVPDGLIAFTREFLTVQSPAGTLPTFSDAISARTRSMLDRSLSTHVSKIDDCPC